MDSLRERMSAACISAALGTIWAEEDGEPTDGATCDAPMGVLQGAGGMWKDWLGADTNGGLHSSSEPLLFNIRFRTGVLSE